MSSRPRHSSVALVLGLLGVAEMVLGAWIWWRIASSPGDDNFLGLIGVVVAVLGLVPSYGIVLWARRQRTDFHPLWVVLAISLGVVSLLLCGLLFAWSDWLRVLVGA